MCTVDPIYYAPSCKLSKFQTIIRLKLSAEPLHPPKTSTQVARCVPHHCGVICFACHLVLRRVHVGPEPESSALVRDVLVKGVEVVHQLHHLAHGAGDVASVER